MSPTPEQHIREMNKQVTKQVLLDLLGACLAAAFISSIILLIWSLPDWSWLEHRWIEILSWGGYGHG